MRWNYLASLVLYVPVFAISIILLSDSIGEYLVYILMVFLTHGLFFITIEMPCLKIKRDTLISFILVHSVNFILLITLTYFIFSGSSAYYQLVDILHSLFGDEAVRYAFFALSLLICFTPGSELVRLIMKHFYPESNNIQSDNDPGLGRVIGKFERTIILILGFMGWSIAIGLVITAKTLARFESFKEEGFVGKFLIGTFSSITIPIIMLFIMFHL